MDSGVLVAAWGTHNRQRFSQAMRKARSDIGQGGNFPAIVRRAWASDPGLRDRFGDAVSAGLKRMWSNPVVRVEQSRRIKQSYTPQLRRQRSERLKTNWANAAFREKMKRARGRAGEQPNKEAV